VIGLAVVVTVAGVDVGVVAVVAGFVDDVMVEGRWIVLGSFLSFSASISSFLVRCELSFCYSI
jgi:hypothetical protein